MKKIFPISLLLFTLLSCNNNPDDIRNEAMILFKEEQFKEAIEKFSKCIKINPNDSAAYL